MMMMDVYMCYSLLSSSVLPLLSPTGRPCAVVHTVMCTDITLLPGSLTPMATIIGLFIKGF